MALVYQAFHHPLRIPRLLRQLIGGLCQLQAAFGIRFAQAAGQRILLINLLLFGLLWEAHVPPPTMHGLPKFIIHL